MKKCRAHLVRKQIQKRDEMIQQNHERRFKLNHHTKTVCTKLLSNGKIISDPNKLLNCWADHFHTLGQSQGDSNEDLHLSQQRVSQLQAASHNEYDNVLDTTIGVEEVEFAIIKLKKGRTGGHDNISPEHLKFCGPILKNWLCQVYNRICQLEQIPKCSSMVSSFLTSN